MNNDLGQTAFARDFWLAQQIITFQGRGTRVNITMWEETTMSRAKSVAFNILLILLFLGLLGLASLLPQGSTQQLMQLLIVSPVVGLILMPVMLVRLFGYTKHEMYLQYTQKHRRPGAFFRSEAVVYASNDNRWQEKIKYDS